MIKAVIFDLDGTLVDSEEGITKTMQYAMGKYGMAEDDLSKYRKFIGPPLFDNLKKQYGFDDETAKEAIGYFRERYSKYGIFESKLYPGVKECLQNLRDRGYLLGIASSKHEPACKTMLKYHGVLDLFDNISGADDKKHIDSKEDVLNELFKQIPHIKKEEMVLVGDTIFDILGAKECGIRSIAVSFGFGDTSDMMNKGAAALCDNMLALPEIIANL